MGKLAPKGTHSAYGTMANALLEKLSLPKLMTKPTKPIRIMVVGQEGVGKTGKSIWIVRRDVVNLVCIWMAVDSVADLAVMFDIEIYDVTWRD